LNFAIVNNSSLVGKVVNTTSAALLMESRSLF